jgi:hypothetical protein
MTDKEMPRTKRDELQEELLALVNGGGDAELSAAEHEHILRRKAQKIGRFAVLLCGIFREAAREGCAQNPKILSAYSVLVDPIVPAPGNIYPPKDTPIPRSPHHDSRDDAMDREL